VGGAYYAATTKPNRFPKFSRTAESKTSVVRMEGLA
jgi:hypothetical protein